MDGLAARLRGLLALARLRAEPGVVSIGEDGRARELRTRVLPFVDPLAYTFTRVE